MHEGIQNMKTGNVILAIFLWLCIPAALFFASLNAAFSHGGEICMITPIALFFLGLVALITGREHSNNTIIYQQKTSYSSEDNPNNEIIKKEKYCIECGKKINNSAKYCPYCGKQLR